MYFEVILGLGSNLGDRAYNLNKAISYFNFLKSLNISLFIESDALLPEGAPSCWNIPYLNCAVSGKTRLNPDQIFSRIKNIEKTIGRDASSPRWSPRIIDIDILFYDTLRIKTKELTIPHPEVFNRTFALTPSLESAPHIVNHFIDR